MIKMTCATFKFFWVKMIKSEVNDHKIGWTSYHDVLAESIASDEVSSVIYAKHCLWLFQYG